MNGTTIIDLNQYRVDSEEDGSIDKSEDLITAIKAVIQRLRESNPIRIESDKPA